MKWTSLISSAAGLSVAAGLTLFTAPVAMAAYDGTHCKAPGNCWEPQPGYPEQGIGSKYDPHHDPKELAKQQEAEDQMDERNAKRVRYFKSWGQFIYDVNKIPSGPK
ncbi:methanol dehydrogenase [Methylocapsa acidiphila]|uniref:methanol dehydrogenase n=1 Tax=Methylocapsa acidiphila TaxID=133552 RepID=UPI0003FD161A|nr:methanol dehydrogenase [Methylocapsa acidiphila]